MDTICTDAGGARLARRFVEAVRGYARPSQVDADICFRFGGIPVLVAVRGGQVARAGIVEGPMCSWDFSLSAGAPAWERFWRPFPEAGWHDVFALAKRGEMAIEGNLQPLMANLQYVKDMAALGREAA